MHDTLVVLVTDPTRATSAIAAVRAELPGSPTLTLPVRSRAVKRSFVELAAVKKALYSKPLPRGTVFVDIDEHANEIVVGTVADGLQDWAAARASLGREAAEAIHLEAVARPVMQATLDDPVRPAIGALRIVMDNMAGGCTLGFNAKKGGSSVRYFATNAHCSPNRGFVDGTVYGQPVIGGQYSIGAESDDPPFSTARPGCPIGPVLGCRTADVLLAAYYPSTTVGLYTIAQTTFAYYGQDTAQAGSRTLATTPFLVNDQLSDSQLIYGLDVNKIGGATGWTGGLIVQSCVDYFPGLRLSVPVLRGRGVTDGRQWGSRV